MLNNNAPQIPFAYHQGYTTFSAAEMIFQASDDFRANDFWFGSRFYWGVTPRPKPCLENSDTFDWSEYLGTDSSWESLEERLEGSTLYRYFERDSEKMRTFYKDTELEQGIICLQCEELTIEVFNAQPNCKEVLQVMTPSELIVQDNFGPNRPSFERWLKQALVTEKVIEERNISPHCSIPDNSYE
jgi:hypothetical protein